MLLGPLVPLIFLFISPPPTPIHPLSLHDALPICHAWHCPVSRGYRASLPVTLLRYHHWQSTLLLCGRDRKSTRLNSSHVASSYAVFCLKKKMHDHARPIAAGCVVRIHSLACILHI